MNTEGEQDTEAMAETELGEAELQSLCGFLQKAITSLLAVNKDLLNLTLHTPEKQELLKAFARDKGQRSLVVAKIEKPATNTSVDGVDSSSQNASDSQSSIRPDGNIEISISTKVEFLGANAQTIAFLKREDYSKLDLSGGIDLQARDVNISAADTASGNPPEEGTDLSSQIQVVNLGYLGQDSNIYELASTYVDFSFLPLFQDYKNKTQVAQTGGDQSQAAGGLERILKGLSSLKAQLSQARHNTEIPMVELTIDPEVKAKFDAAAKSGTFVQQSDFDDKVANSPEFMTRLHTLVQGWYKEIRKVTTLEHAIENGTAS